MPRTSGKTGKTKSGGATRCRSAPTDRALAKVGQPNKATHHGISRSVLFRHLALSRLLKGQKRERKVASVDTTPALPAIRTHEHDAQQRILAIADSSDGQMARRSPREKWPSGHLRKGYSQFSRVRELRIEIFTRHTWPSRYLFVLAVNGG